MLALHVFSVIFSFVTILRADFQALSWLLGKQELLSEERLRRYHSMTWAGLVALTMTGSFLSYPMLGYLFHQPLFIMKLLFVAMLITNAILISRHLHLAASRPFASLSIDERLPLFASAGISFAGWFGALILALVLFG